MRDIGQVVMYQLFCRRPGCGAKFHICRHCYRGQSYCSDACRSIARRRQMDEARRRYRNTLEAKLDQRDRQRQWRFGRSPKNTVMDQGSSTERNERPSKGRNRTAQRPFRWAAVRVALKNGLAHVSGAPHCVICGRVGKFVNPYNTARSYSP